MTEDDKQVAKVHKMRVLHETMSKMKTAGLSGWQQYQAELDELAGVTDDVVQAINEGYRIGGDNSNVECVGYSLEEPCGCVNWAISDELLASCEGSKSRHHPQCDGNGWNIWSCLKSVLVIL